MKASYTKNKDHYILHLGELNFHIPFTDEYNGITISDEIMELAVHRYNNECLYWAYNGKPLTDEVKQKLRNNEITFKDIQLMAK